MQRTVKVSHTCLAVYYLAAFYWILSFCTLWSRFFFYFVDFTFLNFARDSVLCTSFCFATFCVVFTQLFYYNGSDTIWLFNCQVPGVLGRTTACTSWELFSRYCSDLVAWVLAIHTQYGCTSGKSTWHLFLVSIIIRKFTVKSLDVLSKYVCVFVFHEKCRSPLCMCALDVYVYDQELFCRWKFARVCTRNQGSATNDSDNTWME